MDEFIKERIIPNSPNTHNEAETVTDTASHNWCMDSSNYGSYPTHQIHRKRKNNPAVVPYWYNAMTSWRTEHVMFGRRMWQREESSRMPLITTLLPAHCGQFLVIAHSKSALHRVKNGQECLWTGVDFDICHVFACPCGWSQHSQGPSSQSTSGTEETEIIPKYSWMELNFNFCSGLF